MKRYQETMLKDFEILLPYILLLGVLVLLAIFRIFVARFHEDISNLHDMLK